ncbi:ATP-binding protein [Paenibacillus sp. HWE-109]|uniref:AAA family ATPase n=1 Tax=Paenibacillus sp. HWE-109 TaxID=1306526 RepID=UPI001EDCD327|nr:AAA family ATPase [Paenibacillus sp. HWE-109]UKS25817.1 ATP-binding protein [Paenibacillus sp. HWE-109]
MYLNRVSIENFRSIEKITISFITKCRVLVGKNEVGKSNILKALSTLNSNNKINNNDLRDGLPDENLIREGKIWFFFTLDSKDKNTILVSQTKKVLTKDINKLALFTKEGEEELLKNIIDTCYDETIYKVAIPTGKRMQSTTPLKSADNYVVPSNLKKPIANTEYTFDLNGELVNLNSFDLINIQDFPEIPPIHYENVTGQYILKCISTTINDFALNNKVDTIFWRYENKHLLPPSIIISTFISNPDSCLPLKSMFELAGINNIPETIQDAISKNKQGLRNLLDRVATKTTEHFQNVWNEYNHIRFELSPNGEHIEASIKDKFNRYELVQRSDGFKRFISFLLSISAKVQSDNMKNALLLFDEPDLGLHPSGQKYLRDELIKISTHNHIIYSTHSIFMIDKEEISRHLIVDKSDEQTKVTEVNESNFVDEEVIFKALGFSVFETLKSKNIIFEGWKDKELFSIAMTNVPEKYKDVKKLIDAGLCHAKGVKDVKHIANILELANRQYIILSDNDKPAREWQKEFVKLRMHGVWKRYDELTEGFNVSTVEDFIKPHCFIRTIDELRENTYKNLPLITKESFITTKPKLLILDDALKVVETDKESRKQIIEEIKDMVIENLKPADLEDSYYLLLENLLEEIFPSDQLAKIT